MTVCDVCGSPRCPGLRAEVYRSGRWRWTIKVTDGPMVIGDPMYGMPTAWGRERAERKAQKIMAKLRCDRHRRSERVNVTDQYHGRWRR